MSKLFDQIIYKHKPRGYWRLGEPSGTAANDELLRYPGVYNGAPTLAQTGALTGDTDTAVTFASGSSQYVAMGDVIDFDDDDVFSVVGFFKTASTNTQSIVSKRESAGNLRGWDIFMDATSHYLNISLCSVDSTDKLTVQVQTAYNDNAWHYFAVMYDGSAQAAGITVVVDGVLQTTSTVVDTLDPADTISNTAVLNIAGRNSTDQFFTGTIDEVAIYDYELTEFKAKEFYFAALGEFEYARYVFRCEPEVFVRFGDLSLPLTDSSSYALTLTTVGSPELNYKGLVEGDSSTCVLFDKTASQYITLNGLGASAGFIDGQTMSIGMWFNTIDNSTDGLTLFSAQYTAYENYFTVSLNHTDGGVGQVTVHTMSDAAQNFGSGYNDGEPHLLVVVFTSATTFDVYVDALLVGSGTNTTVPWSVIAYVSIGQKWTVAPAAANFFDGYIDEFFITKYVLTQANIFEMSGSGLDYDRGSHPFVSAIGQLKPKAWWRLGEASGTVLREEYKRFTGSTIGTPGYAQPGALTGDATTSLYLDGSGDDLSLTSNFGFAANAPFSVFVWEKDTQPGATRIIVGTRQAAAPYRGYEIGYSAANNLSVTLCDTNPTKICAINAVDTSFRDGAWHHVGFTYDGSATSAGLKLYVDGVAIAVTVPYDSLSPGDNIVSGTALRASRSNAYNFRGYLQEVLVFDRELLPEEIGALYIASQNIFPYEQTYRSFMPTSLWRLGDISGTVTDEMGVNDGTAVNSPTYGATGLISADADNDAMVFTRASSQRIDVASAALVADLTGFTINAFIKPTSAGPHRIWQESAAANEGCAMYINGSDLAEFLIRYSSTDYTATGSLTDVTIASGRIYMITARLDSTGMSVFVNGRLAGTDANTNPSDETINDVDIAAKVLATAAYMEGTLDEVSVYSYALPDASIENLFLSSLEAFSTPYAGSYIEEVYEALNVPEILIPSLGKSVTEYVTFEDAPGILEYMADGIDISTVMSVLYHLPTTVVTSVGCVTTLTVQEAKQAIESLIMGTVQTDQLMTYPVIADNLTVQDIVLLTWELAAVDSIDVADVVADASHIVVVVTSLLAAAGLVADTVHVRNLITEAVVLQVLQKWSFELVATDSVATTADAIELYRAVIANIEAMEFTDAVAGTSSISLLLTESLDAADTVNWNQVLNVEATESLIVGGTLVLDDAVYSAIVLNATTLAPTEYTNFPFNSFGKIGSTNLGATDTAIYALAGANDDGVDIDAVVRSGMTTFGTSQFKRVPRAYIGYTCDGALILKTLSTGGTTDGTSRGQQIERWYELTPRTADAAATARIKLGRGVKATYWQFELVNKDGADFTLDTLKLLPVVLSRRV